MNSSARVPLAAALAILLTVAGEARGQGTTVDTVVITAERTATPIGTSAAAVTRLDERTLRALPRQTVAAALELVPGITVLHADALGGAPRLAVRGFYGGGETEYVTVLLDGVPLTGLAAGQVNWDLVPLAALEAIEVVRGGASALYGDAAVGGVVNLVTRRESRYGTWRTAAGSFGVARAGGAVGGAVGGRRASAFGDVRRSTGYRSHEARASGSLGGSLALAASPRGALTLSTLHHRRTFEEPGPLERDAAADAPRGVDDFYGRDETIEQLHRLTVDGSLALGAGRHASGFVSTEYAQGDAVRTLPLSADFADTKDRATRTARVLGNAQYTAAGLLGGLPSRLVVGTDASAGRLTSRYTQLTQGGPDTYATPATTGDIDARGAGTRMAAAGFASWELVPVAPLRLTIGGRWDWIADAYAPRAPSEGATTRVTRKAFSPRAGANLRYLDGARQSGHAYLSVGRAFKAPTMDQLFDQRTTPVPFEPYRITLSNAALRAQSGTNLEAGLYHRVRVAPLRTSALLSGSVYQMEMKDELDFDLQQFRYVNIGRSRHRGAEVGLTVAGPAATRGTLTLARQDATSRFGANAGRFLKAVPRRTLAAGLSRMPASGLAVAATVTAVRDVPLDDANTLALPPYARTDVRASYPLRGARLSLAVQNVLGRAFSTTGYPDPAGSGAVYLYPAARRAVTLGVESRL